jgi:hypothetical protein
MAFVVLGIGHSYLGERLVLAPILRLPNLPKLGGSTRFMQQILRLAWHVTSLAWFGLAGIVVMLAYPSINSRAAAAAVGITSIASFLSVLVFTRGKHVVAWVLFLLISIVTLLFASGI